MEREVYYKKNGTYRQYRLADRSGAGATKQTSRAKAEACVGKLFD